MNNGHMISITAGVTLEQERAEEEVAAGLQSRLPLRMIVQRSI